MTTPWPQQPPPAPSVLDRSVQATFDAKMAEIQEAENRLRQSDDWFDLPTRERQRLLGPLEAERAELRRVMKDFGL